MLYENNKNVDLTMLRKQKYYIADNEWLGMKWYKFNIYFRLVLGILVLISDIQSALITYGNLWGISWSIDAYLSFAVIFDLALIVGTILTRHWLVYFEKKGILLYFITQYLSQIVLFIAVFLFVGFNEDSVIQMLINLIVYGIFFAFEYKYWKKRIHLFSKYNQSTYLYSNKINNTHMGTPNFNIQKTNTCEIRFCRKCGFKLIDNSKFCSRCGTRIVENSEM